MVPAQPPKGIRSIAANGSDGTDPAAYARASRSPAVAHRIELPVPFPLGTVNAWLFAGSQPALVDCGVASSRSYQALLDGLRAAGCDPASLTLYVTHGHVDHAGNARRLRDDFGVQLLAPASEAEYIETFRRDGPRRNDEFAAALRAHGVPEDAVLRMRADSDAIDRFLEDSPIAGEPGARVVLGDTDAQVIATPGHTPGSTSFLLSEDNDMVTGDTLLQIITSNAVELRDADRGRYHQYLATLDGMRAFVGVTCLPGHHAPFRLTDAILDDHLGRHEKRRQVILSLLARPRTGYGLFPLVFPGLDGDPALFMGMAEIVGHLHALEMDGLVRRQDETGIRHFVAT